MMKPLIHVAADVAEIRRVLTHHLLPEDLVAELTVLIFKVDEEVELIVD